MEKKIIAVFILAVVLLSCRKDQGPILIPPVHPAPISFSNDIQPILDANCVSCHDETHFALNLKPCCSWYELMATGMNAPYIDTINPSQSALHMRLTGAQTPAMPPGNPLTQAEIDLVYKWIEEGAKNN